MEMVEDRMDTLPGLVAKAMRERENAEEGCRAFEELVVLFQDMIYGYAYGITGDAHSARDAAQESFITAYRRLGSLRAPEAFPSWLRTITHRQCLRISSRRERMLTGEEEGGLASGYPEGPEMVDREETRREIRRALDALSEENRAPILLSYFSGYYQEEIAGFLGISVDAVKKRVQRGKAILKEEIEKMIGENMEIGRPSKDDRLLRNISLAVSFDYAGRLGELTLIEQMLSDGIDPDEKDIQGRTLLHWAAWRGHAEAVRLLLKSGASPTVTDDGGFTPDQLAKSRGYDEIASLINPLRGGGRP